MSHKLNRFVGQVVGQLTELKIKNAADGTYIDGAGLMLRKRGGSRLWVLRVMHAGRRTDTSLGSWPEISLREARERAVDARRKIKGGVAPATTRKEPRTLLEAVEDFIRATAPSWRSKTEEGHTRNQLRQHLGHLYARPISSITQDEMLAVFRSVWDSPAVADRLLSRTRRVFLREGMLRNLDRQPLEWAGIRLVLPRHHVRQKHHPAVDVGAAPATYARLRQMTSLSAMCLRLIVLTAVRSGEARGARWDEFDGDRWTVPEVRTKTGRSLVVPLSPEAVKLLASIPRLDPVLVFPGATGRPLRDMSVLKTQRLIAPDAVVHGWRSTFRDWCSLNKVDPVLAETSLNHAVGSGVERAYARSDLVELRRPVMAGWSRFLTKK